MELNKKKYVTLEPILNHISGNFIRISKEESKINHEIVQMVVDIIVNEMKRTDQLFGKMFKRIFPGGSFYDRIRVKSPTEFDLDFLLALPAKCDFITSNVPGYLHCKVENLNEFMKTSVGQQYKNLDKLFDNNQYLNTANVLSWMEGVLQRTLNNIATPYSRGWRKLGMPGSSHIFVAMSKNGPAFQLNVSTLNEHINLEIDLVAAFTFNEWPKGKFIPNPVPYKSGFFIVPKPPKRQVGGIERYWRISFQEQERELINNKRTLKYAVKLLKKLRDTQGHTLIASYYIKTVALWLDLKFGNELWNSPISYVFMIALKTYQNYIENGFLPFYWNKNNNLLEGINKSSLVNISNRLRGIINDVERHLNDDPKIILKYMVNDDEILELTAPLPESGPDAESNCVIL